MAHITDKSHVAAVTALAEVGVPTDVQELLVAGNPDLGIPPAALAKALEAALAAEAGNPLKLKIKPLVWKDSGVFSFDEGPTYSEAVGAGFTYIAEAIGCTLEVAKADREKEYEKTILSAIVGAEAASR